MSGSKPHPEGAPPVYSIGHSTRSTEEMVGLLREHEVDLLVDVRRFPGSRRHPHFGSERLARSLEAAGIRYLHAEALGGRRDPTPDSPNTGWRNRGFRAYADYLASEAFSTGLEGVLEERRAGRRVCLMCAEAVPWRCHRQLIADVLTARGVEVRHILGPGKSSPHELNPMARVDERGRVTYPGEAGQGELF